MKRNWILICTGLIGAAIVAGTAAASIVEEKTGAAEKTEKEITAFEEEPELLEAPGTYIISDSDIRSLTEDEVMELPEEERRMAAYEIFARRGRIFTEPSRRDYFTEQNWYRGRMDGPHFETDFLNRYEKENVELLRSCIDYMIPGSDKRFLTEEEISDLTEEEIIIAENEILARHGFIFEDPSYQSYFEGKSWYKASAGEDTFNDKVLNDYENMNLADLSMAKQNILRERTAHDGIMIKGGF